MKHLFTFFLAFWALTGAGQSLNWLSQPQFKNTMYAFEHGPNDRWFVGGTQYLPSKGIGTVVCLLPNGQQAWKIDLDYASETEVTQMLPFPNGNLLVTGGGSDCDVIYPGFITMRDINGNPLWTVEPFDLMLSDFLPFQSRVLALAPDGNFFMAGDRTVQKHDAGTGALIEAYTLNGMNFPNDLYYEETGNLFVIGGNKGLTLFSPSHQTELMIKPVTANARIIKVLPWVNGNVLGLTDKGTLEEFSPSGTVVVHPLNFFVSDMDLYNNGLIICGRASTSSVMRFIDDQFVEQGGMALPYQDLYAQFIRADAGGYVLAGVEMNGPAPRLPNTPYSSNFSQRNNQHFWVQHVDDDVLLIPGPDDAGLAELIEHTQPVAKLAAHGDDYAPWEVKGGTFSVRLVNNGTVPLHSVTINASGYGEAGPSFTCAGLNTVLQEFTNLNLAPGEEKVIYLGEIGSSYVASVHPWEWCIWTSRPNGHSDSNHENDYTCRSFDLTTSVRDIRRHEISIYPNPVQESIFVENPAVNPGLCRILNVAGQALSEQLPVEDNGIYLIPVNDLPKGVYFLQTEIGWGRFIKM